MGSTPSTWLATAMIRFRPTLSLVYLSTALIWIERFSQSKSTSASGGLCRFTQSVERWNSRRSLINGLSKSGAFFKVSATPDGSTIDQYSPTISPYRASNAALSGDSGRRLSACHCARAPLPLPVEVIPGEIGERHLLPV